MAYSDSQKELLRQGLKQVHSRYEDLLEDDEGSNSWLSVRESIAEVTGTEIASSPKNGQERIRQFVEGYTDKSKPGVRLYPKNPKWLTDVAEYLIDQKILMPYELEEETIDYSAFIKLSGQLNSGQEGNDSQIPTGKYIAITNGEWGYDYIELFVHKANSNGISRAVEVRRKFSKEDFDENKLDDFEWQGETLKDHHNNGGWIVQTNERTLLIFMKDKISDSNYQYISSAASENYLLGGELNEVVFFRQDMPLPLFDEGDLSQGNINRLGKNNFIKFELDASKSQ